MGYRALSQYRSELMGVAMLWVMLFHSFDLDLGVPLLNAVRAAGFGGVDIFILLSSVGLTMSFTRREQDYSTFMLRRAGRILPAYYTVMIPYTLFLILAQGAPWSSLLWNSTLLYYWIRCPGAFNWYICGAMFFYLLTPPVLRWLREQEKKERLLLSSGALILAGLALCQLLTREGYYYTLDIFYRVPVFVLGLVMGIFITRDRPLGGKDLLFWAGWTALGAAYLWASLNLQGEGHLFFYPLVHLFLFSTVPMCLVLCLLFQKLPLGWLRRFLRLIGENSLEIYLLNVSVFSQIELLRQFVSFGPSNRLYFLLSYIVNITLGILLHKLVEWARGRYQARKAGTAVLP